MSRKIYKFEDFTLDCSKRRFLYKNDEVELSSKAFEVLSLLVQNCGDVVSKDEIFEKIWAGSFVDTSFDNDGKKTFSFGNNLNFEQAQSVLIQPNNKILIGGFSGSVTDEETVNAGFALARLNSNGSFDINFGNGGLVKTNLSEQASFGYKVISQPDGKIILGGISGSGDVELGDLSPALVRYLDENVSVSKKQFDYDGDGKADLAVFRDGIWYLLQTTNGVSISQFGTANDKPIANSFAR